MHSQNRAIIRDTIITMKTYPFSDPNPIPNPELYYYPYFRFDGFSVEGQNQKWKEVVLENDYVKVSIFPEIGGKIWGAIEKSTGNEFVYYNSVVKFRDIAMRGPWTSGGLELNFGIIGHTPTTSTPVDYDIQTNDDGSVSCFLSATDLITRTRWETEVNLQKNKAYFTTKTTYHNPTPLTQPYYQWINGAFQAEGDLEFCFPGSHWIGHDGEANEWPNDEQGRNLSFYRQNNFGGDKSYHIVGGINEFFAAYWHETDFGSVHYSPYGEKLGRKIFLWSQARSGTIWEDLLTDNDGQYVEFQSGRLFNQAVPSSTQTPFKHFGFEPYATDVFVEYWFPVKNTKGVRYANQIGVLNLEKEGSKLQIHFCPSEEIEEKLSIYFGDQLTHEFLLDLDVLENWLIEIDNNKNEQPLTITIGKKRFVYNEEDEKALLNRPMQAPSDFDWNSTYGLFIDGQHWVYQNNFQKAMECFQKCLEKDYNYAPALNQMAILLYRKGEFKNSLLYSTKSLSINTYDTEANFIYGLANKKIENWLNAQDGFAVASLSPTHRNAAYNELSKLFLYQNDLTNARHYASKILEANNNDIEGNKLMAVICRKQGETKEAQTYLQAIENLVHLNHHVSVEHWFLKKSENHRAKFKNQIKSELPHESYLELAYWYQEIGDIESAIQILEESPDHAMVFLNLAYCYELIGSQTKSSQNLDKALKMPSDFVFPFRLDDMKVLDWAVEHSNDWKPMYYLGLFHWNKGNKTNAKELFLKISKQPDNPYFYIAKSILFANEKEYSPEEDLNKAKSLGADDWRTFEKLIDYYLQNSQSERALINAEEALKKFPANNTLKYIYAKCLMAEGQYSNARKALMNTTILPNEGARFGRITYRQACIMEIIELYKQKKYKTAVKLISQSRLWPENLGAGKPYNEDERIEDFLEAQCMFKLGKSKEVKELYQKVIGFTEQMSSNYNSADYVYLIVLQNLKDYEQIDNYINSWEQFNPEDNLLKWSKAKLQNNQQEALEIENQINTITGGTPWDPKYADPEFEIIKTIAKIF